ncbi:MAG: hypothetical protein LH649_16110 [Pseudanabaena sp. CAN_BIN31]|nr:hypothetical protein [Pseudanabaena sp. CAN_BIN31]
MELTATSDQAENFVDLASILNSADAIAFLLNLVYLRSHHLRRGISIFLALWIWRRSLRQVCELYHHAYIPV